MLVVSRNTKVIKLDWLNFEVVLIDTEKKFDFFIKRNSLENEPISQDWKCANGSCAIFDNEPEGLSYYVMVIRRKELDTVVHECVHMVHMMMDKKDIPIDYDNTEVMAYMTGWLFKEVKKNLRK